MGGGIKVNKAANYIDAETMGGSIDIKEIDGKVKATTMGGDVDVKMVGDPQKGDREVFLKSMGGDITLTVPAELSMDIDIEIAYTKDNEDVKISSDFNLKEERTTEWEKSNGSKKKYVYGKATVGGGKNKVKIRTINGDVILKKG